MSLIKRFVGAIVGSKKAVATIANVLFVLVVAPVANRFGLGITQDQVLTVVGIGAAYVVGQGWADTGKEAAKIAGPVTPIKKPAVVK